MKLGAKESWFITVEELETGVSAGTRIEPEKKSWDTRRRPQKFSASIRSPTLQFNVLLQYQQRNQCTPVKAHSFQIDRVPQ